MPTRACTVGGGDLDPADAVVIGVRVPAEAQAPASAVAAGPACTAAGAAAAARRRCCRCCAIATVAVVLVVLVALVGTALHTLAVVQQQLDPPESSSTGPLDGARGTVDLRNANGKVALQAQMPAAAPTSAHGVTVHTVSCALAVEGRALATVALEADFELVGLPGGKAAADAEAGGRLLAVSVDDVQSSTVGWLSARAAQTQFNSHRDLVVAVDASCEVTARVAAIGGLFDFPYSTTVSHSIDVDASAAAGVAMGAKAFFTEEASNDDAAADAGGATVQQLTLDLFGMASLQVLFPALEYDLGEPVATHHASTAAGVVTCAQGRPCVVDLQQQQHSQDGGDGSEDTFFSYHRLAAGAELKFSSLMAPLSYNDAGELGLFATATQSNALSRILGEHHRAVLYGPDSITVESSSVPSSSSSNNNNDDNNNNNGGGGSADNSDSRPSARGRALTSVGKALYTNTIQDALDGSRLSGAVPYNLCDAFVVCYSLEVDSADVGACLDVATDWSHVLLNVSVYVGGDREFDLHAGWRQASTDGTIGHATLTIVARDEVEVVFQAAGPIAYAHDQTHVDLDLAWESEEWSGTETGTFNVTYTVDTALGNSPYPYDLVVGYTHDQDAATAAVMSEGDLYVSTVGELLPWFAFLPIVGDLPVPGVDGWCTVAIASPNLEVDLHAPTMRALSLQPAADTGLPVVVDLLVRLNQTEHSMYGRNFSDTIGMHLALNESATQVQASAFSIDGNFAFFLRRVVVAGELLQDFVLLTPRHYDGSPPLPADVLVLDANLGLDYDAMDTWGRTHAAGCDECEWTPGNHSLPWNLWDYDRDTEAALLLEGLIFASLPFVEDTLGDGWQSAGTDASWDTANAHFFGYSDYAFARAEATVDRTGAGTSELDATSESPRIIDTAGTWATSKAIATATWLHQGSDAQLDAELTVLLSQNMRDAPFGVHVDLRGACDVHPDTFAADSAQIDLAVDIFTNPNVTDTDAFLTWTDPPPPTIKMAEEGKRRTHDGDWDVGLTGGFLAHAAGLAAVVATGFPEGAFQATSSVRRIDMEWEGPAAHGQGVMNYASHPSEGAPMALEVAGSVNATMLFNTTLGAHIAYSLVGNTVDADVSLADVCTAHHDIDFQFSAYADNGENGGDPVFNATADAAFDFCDQSDSDPDAVHFLGALVHIHTDGLNATGASMLPFPAAPHAAGGLVDAHFDIHLASTGDIANTASAGVPLRAESRFDVMVAGAPVANLTGASDVTLGTGVDAGGFTSNHTVVLWADGLATIVFDVAALNGFVGDELLTLHVPSVTADGYMAAALSFEQSLSCSMSCACHGGDGCSAAALLRPGAPGTKTDFGLHGFHAVTAFNLTAYFVHGWATYLVDIPVDWAAAAPGMPRSVLQVGQAPLPWVTANGTEIFSVDWTTVVGPGGTDTTPPPAATVSGTNLFTATSDLALLLLEDGERVEVNGTLEKTLAAAGQGGANDVLYKSSFLGRNPSSSGAAVNITGTHKFWPRGAGFHSEHAIALLDMDDSGGGAFPNATTLLLPALDFFTGPDVVHIHMQVVAPDGVDGGGELEVLLRAAGPVGWYAAHCVDAGARALDWCFNDVFFFQNYTAVMEPYRSWNASNVELRLYSLAFMDGGIVVVSQWHFDGVDLAAPGAQVNDVFGNITFVSPDASVHMLAGVTTRTWLATEAGTNVNVERLDVNATAEFAASSDADCDGCTAREDMRLHAATTMEARKAPSGRSDNYTVHHVMDGYAQVDVCRDDFAGFDWSMPEGYGYYAWQGCDYVGCEWQAWDYARPAGEPVFFTRCCKCDGGTIAAQPPSTLAAEGEYLERETNEVVAAALDYALVISSFDGSDAGSGGGTSVLTAVLDGDNVLDHYTGQSVTTVELTVDELGANATAAVSVLNTSFAVVTCDDGEATACDGHGGADSDRDGVCDSDDACEGFNDHADDDGDNIPDGCDTCDDSDSDGVCDYADLCPGSDDADDIDGDGVPNDCDECPFDNPNDTDDDGVCDSEDDCPLDPPDSDDDNDGVCDSDDICDGSDDTVDTDADGVPDGCDSCPLDNPDDTDADGVCDSNDACPGNDDAADADSDGLPDACDDCAQDADNDADSDALCGDVDSCPHDAFGDADSDGVCHNADPCPYEPHVSPPCTVQGCDGPAGGDQDSDGICSAVDVCPDDAANDADHDSVCDSSDTCPGDATNDADMDGVCGAQDSCPADADNDADGDSMCSNVDPCPDDAENDADSDGVCGDVDVCPNDADDDADADSICGDTDTCPNDADNDADGDLICGDADSCPNHAENDPDGDGTCGLVSAAGAHASSFLGAGLAALLALVCASRG